MWIDTHCHLAGKEFDADREEVIQRANDAGVKRMVVIGAGEGMEGNARAIALAESAPGFYAVVGLHPHDAAKAEGEDYLERLKIWGRHPKVSAIGEIGLDYHYDFAPRAVQQQRFREQIALAKTLDLPVAIHTREAWEDTLKILKEEGVPKRGGVFHCFGGGLKEAGEALALGFFISIPGILTFKKAGSLEDVVRETPLEKLMVETDAPYLAPVPHRGKRNEPAYIPIIGAKIAAIKKVAPGTVERVTTENAKRLLNIR